MAITAGSDILASDFINTSAGAGDSGKAPKLDSAGKLDESFEKAPMAKVMTAGETINGATLPVPIYQNTTDNEVYACDGNDTAKLNFIGFAVSNSTNGNSIDTILGGIVGGFSGLDEGEEYYVQDAVGTIGKTPGTYNILVGIAISATEILIIKNKRVAIGSGSFSATGNVVVTTGFAPKSIIIVAVGVRSTGGGSTSNGKAISTSSQHCLEFGLTGGDVNAIRSGKIVSLSNLNLTSRIIEASITVISQTGFTINVSLYTAVGSNNYSWIAYE